MRSDAPLMPEMPEVEVVRRGLSSHVRGLRIERTDVLHPRAVRRQRGGARQFDALIVGRTVVEIQRRGKFLWAVTDDDALALAAHLGMSGQFRVCPGDSRAPKHARAGLGLSSGRQLWFVDQRTFGWVAAAPVVVDRYGRRVPEPVAGIALDPADAAFDGAAVARQMNARRVEVKRLLLDQSLVSGIGNIYADEALWRAGIHPRDRADLLPVAGLCDVLRAAAGVMQEALAEGGTSFDGLYVDVNGRSGYFARGLSAYGRAGEPCPRCGAPIRREAFMNRSSHLCPRCQLPRGARDYGHGPQSAIR